MNTLASLLLHKVPISTLTVILPSLWLSRPYHLRIRDEMMGSLTDLIFLLLKGHKQALDQAFYKVVVAPVNQLLHGLLDGLSLSLVKGLNGSAEMRWMAFSARVIDPGPLAGWDGAPHRADRGVMHEVVPAGEGDSRSETHFGGGMWNWR